MPLTERLIDQRFSYLNGKFIDEGEQPDGSSLLKDVQMGSMYGTIVQLGYLAQYAHQIFDELFEEAKGFDTRISALTSRTKTLMEQLDQVTPPLPVAPTTTAAPSGHRHLASMAPLPPQPEPLVVGRPVNGLFNRDSQPAAIRDRYRSAAVAPMPAFHTIDAVIASAEVPLSLPGGLAPSSASCAVQYSYPEFFFNEWKKAEEERLGKLQEEKRQRKLERQARKLQLKEVRESQKKNSAINVKQLDWRKKYAGGEGIMPSTRVSSSRNLEVKELIQRKDRGGLITSPGGLISSPVVASPSQVAVVAVSKDEQQQQQQQQPPQTAPFFVGKGGAPEEKTIEKASDDPPQQQHHHQSFAPPRPEAVVIPSSMREDQVTNNEDDDAAAPPVVQGRVAASSHASSLSANNAWQQQHPQQQLRSVPEDDDAAVETPATKRIIDPADLPVSATMIPTSLMSSGGGGAQQDEEEPAPQKDASTAVAPPPRPNNPMGGGPRMSMDLLSSIATGKALKPATPEATNSKATPGSGAASPSVSKAKISMLSEIKMNKTKLKHVDNSHDQGSHATSPTGAAKKAAATPSLATEVQSILARRKFLQAQSDSDDSEEDAWKD